MDHSTIELTRPAPLRVIELMLVAWPGFFITMLKLDVAGTLTLSDVTPEYSRRDVGTTLTAFGPRKPFVYDPKIRARTIVAERMTSVAIAGVTPRLLRFPKFSIR